MLVILEILDLVLLFFKFNEIQRYETPAIRRKTRSSTVAALTLNEWMDEWMSG